MKINFLSATLITCYSQTINDLSPVSNGTLETDTVLRDSSELETDTVSRDSSELEADTVLKDNLELETDTVLRHSSQLKNIEFREIAQS